MKKYYFSFLLVFFLCTENSFAQESAAQLHDNAKAFTQQGDYSNAVLVLKRAEQLAPDDIEIKKDLALNFYLEKENDKALEKIKEVLDMDGVDDQSYQIAGNIYQALGQGPEAEKNYHKGIKKFSSSGALYNDLGQLEIELHNDLLAIDAWENGIKADPSYSTNYYNACKYYYLNGDRVWSIIYGETFLDMEPSGSTSPEIKDLLLDDYKQLFADADLLKNNKDKNKFTQAFLETMNKQMDVVATGITPESLTMIRTRFVLEWFNTYADKYPFRLFEFQRQLLQDGMFDAYNQWIFGASQNLAAYQSWTTTHSSEYEAFSHFQYGRTFKIPSGQYYK